MAEKTTFPMMSASNWWAIRKKFKQTLPGTVTASYLSSILNMQERSASNNILPYLKQIGIIDQDGKTTERAKMWRDDIDYAQVCDDIRKEIYPQELLDIPVESEEDREAVKRWFSRTTGVGETATAKMTSFYMILCEKDASKEPEAATKPNGTQPKRLKKALTPPVSATTTKASEKMDESQGKQAYSPKNTNPQIPPININLQIHISSDASAEQIDKIFESMYKHIYSKKSGNLDE